ncbi:hypothetical protein GF312_07535 [Candidatus Poribacteria bacterium]|nr:hypothetical protein [Candidatus Poribacteria bacterium]
MRYLLISVFIILIVSGLAFSEDFNVLVILGDQSAQAEAAVVESFDTVEGNNFNFTELNIATGGTRPIAGGVIPAEEEINWSEYQMIWFAWNGPGHDGDYFMEGTEEDLVSFVENGGVIYFSAFDDNYRDPEGNQIGGWLPIDEFPCGVDNTGDANAEITPEGEATVLFSVPNKIDDADLSALVLDDNLAPAADEYVVLATRTDNNQPAAVMLPYGKGAYVHVCIDARSTFPAATDLVENLLNYMANLTVPMAVEPNMKLYTIWGNIKSIR